MSDFEYARDKVLMGPAREEVLTEEEKQITAYHEAGHALLAWLTPGCDRVHKVTIMPRGRALGVTQLVPEEERYNISQHDLEAAAGDAARRPGGRKNSVRPVQRRRRERLAAKPRDSPGEWSRIGA